MNQSTTNIPSQTEGNPGLDKKKKPALSRLQQDVLALYGGMIVGGAAASFIPVVGQAGLAVAGGAAATYGGVKLVEKVGIPRMQDAFWGLMDIGNPEGSQGRVGKLIDKIYKWGEKDIPKEFQTALNVYKTGLDLTRYTFLEVPAAIGSTVFALGGERVKRVQEILKNRKDLSVNEKKKLAEKEAERKTEELEREQAIEAFHRTEGYTDYLLDDQKNFTKSLIDSLINTDLPGFQDYKDIINNRNLISYFYLKPEEFDNLENLQKGIESRKQTETDIEELLTNPQIKGDPGEIVAKVYSYLLKPNNPNEFLTDQEKSIIKEKLKISKDEGGTEEGESAVSFKDPKIAKILSELKRILVQLNAGRTLDEIEKENNNILRFGESLLKLAEQKHEKSDNAKASEAEKAAEKKDNEDRLKKIGVFLKNYKESFLSGACISTVDYRADLGMENMVPEDIKQEFKNLGIEQGRNPFMFLGFTNTPEEEDIQKRIKQYEELLTEFPSKAKFKNGFNHFYSVYNANQMRKNLDLIEGMSRKQVEAFDVLSRIFIEVNSETLPFNIRYRGVDMEITEEIAEQFKKAFNPNKENVTPEDNITYNFQGLQDLLVSLSTSREEDDPLRNLIETINDTPLLENDLMFGNSKKGYEDSVVNFIKNLNYPENLFKTIYIAKDGEMPPLDQENRSSAANQSYSISSLLESKSRIAVKLLDLSKKHNEDYVKLSNAHTTHRLRIINGDVEIKRKTEKKRDHQGYIAKLEVLNGDLIQNLKLEKYKALANITKEMSLANNELAVSNFKDPNDFNKIKKGLDKLGKILFIRYSQMVATEGDTEDHTDNVMEEFMFIQNYLQILYALGFSPNNIYTENCINDKLLRMYFNGIDLNRQSLNKTSFKQNVGEGEYSLM